MTYEKAMAEVVKFENTDVVTTSGNGCQYVGITCGENAVANGRCYYMGAAF